MPKVLTKKANNVKGASGTSKKANYLKRSISASESSANKNNEPTKITERKVGLDKSVSLPLKSPAKKRKLIPIATSPRKTRGIHKRDEDSECEACGMHEPLQFLFNCPNCASVFHLTCMSLDLKCVEYCLRNPSKWQCPRCIGCAKCGVYIFDAENVQCENCGRAFHGHCRPKKAAVPVYPFSKWSCDKCESATTSVKNSPLRKSAENLETPRKKLSKSPSKRASPLKRNANKSPKKFHVKIEEDLSKMRMLSAMDAGNDALQERLHENMASISLLTQQGLSNVATTPVLNRPKKRGRRKIDFEQLEEPKTNNENSDFSLAGKMALQKMNVLNQWVYFGQYIRFKPIYESSYPENIGSSPNVYVCEFCFRAISDLCQFKNHLSFCPWKHPPGNEIYRDNSVNIWEVEGNEESIYCRNLCLLAKFFLSSKTLYHEVETFIFYILTEITDRGCVLAGYFSKEKNPSKNNNLSCLLTLPSHQSKGYGKMLIDLSYHLSMREHKIGSPEHPLSDMGLIAYRSYWRSAIVCALRRRRNQHSVSIKELSIETAIHSCDIISTLLALGKLTFRNDCFYIDTNMAFNASLSSFRRRTIDKDLFLWEPSFDVVQGSKMNSYAAD